MDNLIHFVFVFCRPRQIIEAVVHAIVFREMAANHSGRPRADKRCEDQMGDAKIAISAIGIREPDCGITVPLPLRDKQSSFASPIPEIARMPRSSVGLDSPPRRSVVSGVSRDFLPDLGRHNVHAHPWKEVSAAAFVLTSFSFPETPRKSMMKFEGISGIISRRREHNKCERFPLCSKVVSCSPGDDSWSPQRFQGCQPRKAARA